MWKMRAKLLYHVEFFIRMLYDTFKNSNKKNKKKKRACSHRAFLLSVIGNIECEIHYPWIFIIKEFNPDSAHTWNLKKERKRYLNTCCSNYLKLSLKIDSIPLIIIFFNIHFYLYSLKLLLPLVRLIKYWLALFVSHQWLTHIRAYIY